jgi:hypothetical protein
LASVEFGEKYEGRNEVLGGGTEDERETTRKRKKEGRRKREREGRKSEKRVKDRRVKI